MKNKFDANVLLLTKLMVPPLRANRVLRPRLIAKLKRALDCQLTLIAAPAGSGKTTVVSEWVAQVEDPIAYLALDEADNDVSRFLQYVLAAMAQVMPKLGQESQALLADATAHRTLLTLLINEIMSQHKPVVLILDDYHLIREQAVHDLLTYLVEHQPPQLHLMIVSRTEPPLPLPRLRVRGQLLTLHAHELGFTAQEASLFFREVMNLPLEEAPLAQLQQHTEGWIAGLLLAALSLQHESDVTAFMVSVKGSNRFVWDYFAAEVFSRQPQEWLDFLLLTSILKRLNGALSDAITGRQDGAEMLRQLERQLMFVIPLGQERHWYRYHHLFADLLQTRLVTEMGARVPALHQRAAGWFEENGLMAEAIDHALQACDWERATRLIIQKGRQLWQEGQLSTLRGWLARLPEQELRLHAQLCLLSAWALFPTSDLETIAGYVDAADGLIRERRGTGERSILYSEVATVRHTLARMRGQKEEATHWAQEALTHLPSDELALRTTITYNLGHSHRQEGKLAKASEVFMQAIRLGEVGGHAYVALLAQSFLAEVTMLQGHLHEAFALLSQMVKKGSILAIGGAYAGIGRIQYEWDQLDQAATSLQTAIELSERGSFVKQKLDSLLTLMQVRQAQAMSQAVFSLLVEAQQLMRRHLPYLERKVAAWRARLALQWHDMQLIEAWIEGLSPNALSTFEQLTLARAYLAQHRSAPALALTGEIWAKVNRSQNIRRRIESRFLQALAYHQHGQPAQALPLLQEAFTLAQPYGYRRLFLDEGQAAQELLYQAAQEGIMPPYTSSLLQPTVNIQSNPKHSHLTPPPFRSSPPPQQATHALIESLSQRELEVLQWVAKGASNQDIARELIVTIHTVKKHVSHILQKLNASRRTQAVAIARELGLL